MQLPTKDGPLIIDFAVTHAQVEVAPRAPAAKAADPETPPDAPKKVRDTALLHRPVPPMVYDQ